MSEFRRRLMMASMQGGGPTPPPTPVWTVTWYNNTFESFTPNASTNPSYAGFAPANYALFQNKTINMVRLQVRTRGKLYIAVASGLNRGDTFSQSRQLDFSTATVNSIVEKEFEPIEVGNGIIIMHLTNDTGKIGYSNNGSNPIGLYTNVGRSTANPSLVSNYTLCVDFGYGRYE